MCINTITTATSIRGRWSTHILAHSQKYRAPICAGATRMNFRRWRQLPCYPPTYQPLSTALICELLSRTFRALAVVTVISCDFSKLLLTRLVKSTLFPGLKWVLLRVLQHGVMM